MGMYVVSDSSSNVLIYELKSDMFVFQFVSGNTAKISRTQRHRVLSRWLMGRDWCLRLVQTITINCIEISQGNDDTTQLNRFYMNNVV